MPTRSNRLNSNQHTILLLFFKYRFLTSNLLASLKHTDRSVATRSLRLLYKQDYIDRHFDNSYKLAGKSARYFMTKKAIAYLKDHGVDESAVAVNYRNKDLSHSFVDMCLNIVTISLNIEKLYPGVFEIFTKFEIHQDDTMPQPLPALYLNRIDPSDDLPNHYMLDFFTDSQFWLIKKRIDQYIEHYDSSEWDEDEHPTILLALPSSRFEQKTHEYIERALNAALIDVDDMCFMITSTGALKANEERKIWSNATNKLLAL